VNTPRSVAGSAPITSDSGLIIHELRQRRQIRGFVRQNIRNSNFDIKSGSLAVVDPGREFRGRICLFPFFCCFCFCFQRKRTFAERFLCGWQSQ